MASSLLAQGMRVRIVIDVPSFISRLKPKVVITFLVTLIASASGVLLSTLSLAMADRSGRAEVGAVFGYQNAASFALVAAVLAWRIARMPGRLLRVAVLVLPGPSADGEVRK